jgi:hypothetical protein
MNFLAVVVLVFAVCLTDGSPNYSAKEQEGLKKFRAQVSKYLDEDFQKRDGYLLRWVREYNYDFAKAAQRLQRTHEWRKEKEIPGILNEDLKGHRRYLPFVFGGYDRVGRPYFIMSFGKWQLRKYVLAGKQSEASRSYRQDIEECLQKVWETADKTGKDIDQFHLIVDLDGYTVRENLCPGCIPLTMDMATAYDAMTPIFSNLTLVNTPRTFAPILTLLSTTFPRPPLNALKHFDSNADVWQKELLKYIPPDQLIEKLGGTKVL